MRAITKYRFILRLGAKDLDIIALSETDGFTNAVKNALKAFATGRRFVFPMPQTLPRTGKTKARIDLRFYEEDKAIADFLSSVGEGYKNAVILAIIRASLPFPVVSPYLEDDGVYYDLFIKKKKRGRRKGVAVMTSDNAEISGVSDEPAQVPEKSDLPAPYAPVAPAVGVEENEGAIVEKEEPLVAAIPTPPVRPSLVEAVEEEQAADEGQTEGDNADNGENTGSDGFDLFAMGMDMMNSF